MKGGKKWTIWSKGEGSVSKNINHLSFEVQYEVYFTRLLLDSSIHFLPFWPLLLPTPPSSLSLSQSPKVFDGLQFIK